VNVTMTGNASPLADVVGHRRVRQFLAQALASGRVANSYLFTGPPRIGKLTLARSYARWLLCQRSSPGGEATLFDAGPSASATSGPCGDCAACRLLAGGSHPDLLVLEREVNERGRETKNISVEQVERLRHDVGLAPYIGPRKAYVIANAEDLSIAAMNSLLKTLEEPPPGVVMLLTSSEPSLLLPTIVSRCQTLLLAPVDLAEVESALRARGVDAERAHLLACLSTGRIGWALAAADDDDVLSRRDAEMARLVRLPEASRVDRLAYAEELDALNRKDPEALRQRLGLWLAWWRDLALARAGCVDLVANVDRVAQIEEQAAGYSVDQLRQFVGEIDRVGRRLAVNVNPRMALDILLLAVPRPATGRSG
jgi:DNA polymerase III subunit delta'